MNLKSLFFASVFFFLTFNYGYGQKDFTYNYGWEVRLAPNYYFPQTTTFTNKSGNALKNRGGVLGSIYIGKNMYFKKRPDFYLSIQAGFSFYSLWDFQIDLKENKPIPKNYIPSPGMNTVSSDYGHTYFEGLFEMHQQLWRSKWFITGGVGIGVVPRNINYNWIFHNRSRDLNNYIISAYLIGNFPKFPFVMRYNIGIEKVFTLEKGHFGLGLKWSQSFNPYMKGELYLIEEDYSYTRKPYKAFLKTIELHLIIPFL